MNVKPVFKFVHERYQIYQRRHHGEPKPWTSDPILQNYRFTNVYREDDKVTIWIRRNWRDPNKVSNMNWFAMAVARYINWPDTLIKIGYPVPWKPERVCQIMNELAGKKIVKRSMAKSHKNTPYKIERINTSYQGQVFGGAYFLNSIGPKIESIVNDRLTPLWNERKRISGLVSSTTSLQQLHQVLLQFHGFGSFMAAQVVADLKYTPAYSPSMMEDWWTWAASGPGSRRGLNRILERPVNAPWREDMWLAQLQRLQAQINPLLLGAGMPKMHAQDVQGICCCEWDKYSRAKLGEGRPKTKFNGGK